MKDTRAKIQELEEQMDKMGAELGALAYAIQLVEEKHKSAADMVANVPQNIYIEEWKSEERYTAQKLEQLKAIYNEKGKEQAKICAKIDALYNNF